MAAAAAGMALASAGRTGFAGASPDDTAAPDGWATAAPRDEIRPAFAYEPAGGPGGGPCLAIRADAREGLDGCWTRTFPVDGGKTYRFTALYRASNVPVPRRGIVAKLDWK